MSEAQAHENLLIRFDEGKHDLGVFMKGVREYIGEHPSLRVSGCEVVHSYKSRLKDREHLRKKISRKIAEGRTIDEKNFFSEITDLAGIRILHLFQEGFRSIDKVIRKKIEVGDWYLSERVKAYTWDPENVTFFKGFDLGSGLIDHSQNRTAAAMQMAEK